MSEYRRINIEGVYYYGKHLILSGRGCNDNILDIPKMEEFIRTLVKKIDMVAYGQPIVARFGQGIEIGLSAVQLIETSAITIHTNDQARDMYLDVFSCKSFSEQTVLDFVNKTFNPKGINYQTILR
jgi:S-adenosylmethionine/arginine decarboxylase-like enzyme